MELKEKAPVRPENLTEITVRMKVKANDLYTKWMGGNHSEALVDLDTELDNAGGLLGSSKFGDSKRNFETHVDPGTEVVWTAELNDGGSGGADHGFKIELLRVAQDGGSQILNQNSVPVDPQTGRITGHVKQNAARGSEESYKLWFNIKNPAGKITVPSIPLDPKLKVNPREH